MFGCHKTSRSTCLAVGSIQQAMQDTAQHSTAQHSTAQHSTAQHGVHMTVQVHPASTCFAFAICTLEVSQPKCHGRTSRLGVAKLCSLMPCVTASYLCPVCHLFLQTFDKSFVIGSLDCDFPPVLCFVQRSQLPATALPCNNNDINSDNNPNYLNCVDNIYSISEAWA